jgi:N6-adenosine-specific RNA methylase IME4
MRFSAEIGMPDAVGSRDTFAELRALAASGFRAGVIYTDNPLRYDTWGPGGRDRCADRHYPTMTVYELAAMARIIQALAARNCALLTWTSGALERKTHQINDAWGFDYSTWGFVWIKTRKGCLVVDTDDLENSDLGTGLGHTTRSSAEVVLYARRGSPKRLRKDIPQVVIAPRMRHSEKPQEVARRIERLFPGPYLELFSRKQRPGWVCWGEEVPKLILPDLTEAAE